MKVTAKISFLLAVGITRLTKLISVIEGASLGLTYDRREVIEQIAIVTSNLTLTVHLAGELERVSLLIWHLKC